MVLQNNVLPSEQDLLLNNMEAQLFTTYKENVIPKLKEEFGYTNIMSVPKLEKISINVGYGRHAKDNGYIENVEKTLAMITGQKPVRQKAKKSISNFKIREGMNVGSSVTLRGKAMYDFLYKFVHLTLPRIRDFRGINPKSFDKQGNYAIGMKESLAFPEVTGEATDKVHGLEVVIKTTAQNPQEGLALLKGLGLPFKEK